MHDPLVPVLLALAVVLVGAKLGGDLAVRLGQPAVLGELLVGVLLGNLSLAGYGGLDHLKTDVSVDMLARLGVVILLFEVGLESTVAEMLEVGGSAVLVAVLGVAVPFGLGWLVGIWLLPEASVYVHAFLGAVLTATSVGITARVLADLGRSKSREARVILGAAVVDDVLGLMILAVVTGIIGAADRGTALSWTATGGILLKAVLFLVGSIVIGSALSKPIFRFAARLKASGVLLAAGLSFCFLLSWAAGSIGLAPIVGAFAAGLILESLHSSEFVRRGERSLEDLIRPISSFLVPLFFVVMGMRTDLRAFGELRILGLAALLTLAAVVGKQACSLGVLEKGMDRLSIGIGMIPRGEVGLIFANAGQALAIRGEPMIDGATYAAIVAMVIATTVCTPPALTWSLRRGRS